MNWEEVGAIGQMLGSLAVLVTLGYLAVQVRHANYELRRSISQGRGEAIRELFMARATDVQLARLLAKTAEAFGRQRDPFVDALMQRAGLTREEALRLSHEQAAWLNYRIQVFPYVGDLSTSDRAVFDNGIRATYESGMERVYLDTTIRYMAHPDFIRYIDNLLAQPVPTPS